MAKQGLKGGNRHVTSEQWAVDNRQKRSDD